MTTDNETPKEAPDQPWLSFSPDDLTGLRVRQSELARMFEVSRNTVSQWVKKGWITAGPDGLIDPRRATTEIMHRDDAGRFRARVFRGAVGELNRHKTEAEQLKQQLADLKRDHLNAELWYCRLERFQELLDENAGRLRTVGSDQEFSDLCAELYWEADDDCEAAEQSPGNASGAPLAEGGQGGSGD